MHLELESESPNINDYLIWLQLIVCIVNLSPENSLASEKGLQVLTVAIEGVLLLLAFMVPDWQ